jgi:hypothetical protein
MNEHVCGDDCTEHKFVSRKEFRKVILPKVGDIINNCVVVYVHDTKMWFSALGKANIGDTIEMDNRLFKVSYIRPTGDRWNANFIGFKNNPEIPDAPTEETDRAVKLID